MAEKKLSTEARVEKVRVQEQASFTTPASGYALIGVKTDKRVYVKDDAGTETKLAGGPASSTDNAVVRFDGTSGHTLQNSTVIVDDNGGTTLPANIALTGDISPSQITSSQNDYNPTGLSTASTLRLSTDASRSITGLQGGADGRIVTIVNVGSQNLVLEDEDAGSSAANRFALSGDITLAGDDGLILQYDSTSSRWRCVGKSPGGAGGGSSVLVQKVSTQTGEVATGSTTIPVDDTIPQNTEGDEYMTRAITPTNSSNILYITVTFAFGHSSINRWRTVALFQDTTANALAAATNFFPTSTTTIMISFTHKMTAGTTSSTTFKVRAGADSSGTTTFNGAAGGRYFGGVMASSIVIEEVTP